MRQAIACRIFFVYSKLDPDRTATIRTRVYTRAVVAKNSPPDCFLVRGRLRGKSNKESQKEEQVIRPAFSFLHKNYT